MKSYKMFLSYVGITVLLSKNKWSVISFLMKQFLASNLIFRGP
jgi:hypothetical protein